MKRNVKDWRIVFGILLSIFFMYLSFRKVEFGQMFSAFKQASYIYILPSVLIMFFSHWLRALRWQFLLEPIKKIDLPTLYSSLLVGYMANTFLPAHLGEFLRAYMVGKKRPVASGAVFGTIVTERIVDVFTLLVLLALTLVVFPFPDWVKKSGYVSFAGIIVLFMILFLLKRYRDKGTRIVEKVLTIFPKSMAQKVVALLHSFLDGIVPLKRKTHYLITLILSIVIWLCYALIFQLLFYAFDLAAVYQLPWYAALVLLVITTISVLVPSTPGYVGTYHYLCMLSLQMFGVPDNKGLAFAFVAHGINFLPLLIVGLIILSFEKTSLKSMQNEAKVSVEQS
ncbi:flippase-like domain-containing protein [candidate division KSB1 bacterium]|nr:flippase-like domain-containing protein [candidate division KSB1 bacterium]